MRVQERDNVKVAFLLFIVREIIFFFSFFWYFLSLSLVARRELFYPLNPLYLNPLGMPFFRRVILVVRRVFVTRSHISLIEGDKRKRMTRLIITIILGIFFMTNQVLEFKEASFSVLDRVYGRVFYVVTGFHGFHVLVGIIFLLKATWRMFQNTMTRQSHTFISLSVWY
jgi:heme/copper-type cytochrome/quinol oxidase subunit 3